MDDGLKDLGVGQSDALVQARKEILSGGDFRQRRLEQSMHPFSAELQQTLKLGLVRHHARSAPDIAWTHDALGPSLSDFAASRCDRPRHARLVDIAPELCGAATRP
eukprot:720379-Rhodomonas_salina.1